MRPHFTPLDALVVATYFVGVVVVGLWFRRRSRSVEGFTKAQGDQPGWLLGISIVGTYVSSISFLALPGKAFAANWNPFVFSLSIPIAAWIAARWFVPFYRRGGHVSAYAHLEARFGQWARVYASLCYLLTQLARVATVTYLMALPLAVLLGWDIRHLILISGLVTTLVALLGGIAAVIWINAMKTVILIVGAALTLWILLRGIPDGVGEGVRAGAADQKFSLGSFGPGLAEPTFWVVLAYGVVINLQNFGVDQNYIQRFHAAKSDTAARRSLWLGALLYLPISAGFFFIGTALYVYFARHPEALPAEFRAADKADSIFPFFILAGLPSGVTGLLIAALFAAGISTVSSCLNSSATIFLEDFYQRYWRPRATAVEQVRVLYVATAAVGLVGTAFALAMVNVKSVLDAWWLLAGIFGGGMLGLFLLGFVSRPNNGRAALTGLLAGVLVILWMSLSPRWTGALARWRSPFHGFLIIVLGTGTIVMVGALLSALRRRRT